jgi:cytochrome c biogenesis protein CcmG, thiol:disulfide interchange protein DsbE
LKVAIKELKRERNLTRGRFRLGSALGIGCLVLGALLFESSLVALGPPTKSSRATLVNKKAPQIARKDLSGNTIDLRAYRGKVVLLDFWATWCAPCLIEMPIFTKWQQQYGPQGFQVISISMDDDAAPVQKVLAKAHVNYPVAMGDAALGERYGGVLGLPLTYLIDGDGVIRARFQGETNPAVIEKQLKLMLQSH